MALLVTLVLEEGVRVRAASPFLSFHFFSLPIPSHHSPQFFPCRLLPFHCCLCHLEELSGHFATSEHAMSPVSGNLQASGCLHPKLL